MFGKKLGGFSIRYYSSRVAALALLLLLVMGSLSSSQCLSAQGTTIEGSVVLERIQNPTVRMGGGYQDNFGGSTNQEDTSLDDVLVWLEPQNGDQSAIKDTTERKVLNQLDKRFDPRLMIVRAGDVVRILNSDPVYHNVFSLSKAKRFDVGRRSPGEFQDVEFNEPGHVDVFCDIHSDMHAVIVVVPKHTVVMQKLSDSRTFRFDKIPEGQYTLHFYAMNNREARVEISTVDKQKIDLEPIRIGS